MCRVNATSAPIENVWEFKIKMIKNIDRFLQLKTAHGAFVELPVQDDRLEKLGELAILAIVVEILSLVFIANAHSPLPSLTDINGENVFALVSLVQPIA